MREEGERSRGKGSCMRGRKLWEDRESVDGREGCKGTRKRVSRSCERKGREWQRKGKLNEGKGVVGR